MYLHRTHHVSYIIILLSVACIVFLFTNVLIHFYDRLAICQPDSNKDYTDGNDAKGGRARAAEGFELHGIMSADEDDVNGTRRMLNEGGRGSSFESSRPNTVRMDNQVRA
jgi:hypothetical protein